MHYATRHQLIFEKILSKIQLFGDNSIVAIAAIITVQRFKVVSCEQGLVDFWTHRLKVELGLVRRTVLTGLKQIRYPYLSLGTFFTH